MHKITGVLLAAGCSSRFGGHKLLTEIRGKPLILLSAECLSACDRVIAVIRQEDEPLQVILQEAGIDTVLNLQAAQGMGSSLACAIRASEMSDGWCILPADMPYVDKSTTSQIVRSLRNGVGIAAPFYHRHRGHPVGFAKTFRNDLLALEGDFGAREILAAESESVVAIEVEDPGILIDIDTPQDLLAD